MDERALYGRNPPPAEPGLAGGGYDWIRAVIGSSVVSSGDLRGGGSSNGRSGGRALGDIQAHPAIDVAAVDSELGTLAARIAARVSLRGADAVYVALAAQRALPLFTWNQELASRAGAIIDVRMPS